MNQEILEAVKFVQLVSLTARKEHLRQFILNHDAQFEADTLVSQIQAINNIKIKL